MTRIALLILPLLLALPGGMAIAAEAPSAIQSGHDAALALRLRAHQRGMRH